MQLVDVAGWIGGVLVLVAYLMVSLRRVASDGSGYQAMNVAGGVLLMFSAYQAGAFPNLVINVVWIIAGSASIALHVRRRARTTADPEEVLVEGGPGAIATDPLPATLELPLLEGTAARHPVRRRRRRRVGAEH